MHIAAGGKQNALCKWTSWNNFCGLASNFGFELFYQQLIRRNDQWLDILIARKISIGYENIESSYVKKPFWFFWKYILFQKWSINLCLTRGESLLP